VIGTSKEDLVDESSRPEEGERPVSADAVNRQILRGDLTVDEAVKSGVVTREGVAEWQRQFVVALGSGNPVESAMTPVWSFLLQGWRRYISVPLLLLFVVLPGAVTLYRASADIWNVAKSALASRVSEMDASELDTCNEWVARIGRFENREEARKGGDELSNAMKDSNERTLDGDIRIVRDVELSGQYLLVVDMEAGISSESAVLGEIERLKNPGSRQTENAIGNLMLAAKPMYYGRSQFERAYGKVNGACKFSENDA
jgi:hypothetical protein